MLRGGFDATQLASELSNSYLEALGEVIFKSTFARRFCIVLESRASQMLEQVSQARNDVTLVRRLSQVSENPSFIGYGLWAQLAYLIH